MPESTDKEHRFDPKIQSEDIAFRPSELVKCSCGRTNPPNRSACVYCGKALEIADLSTVRFSLRQPETWERGWNLIYLPNLNDPRPNAAVLSGIVGIDAERLTPLLDAGVPVPVARVSSDAELAASVKKLSGLGLDCRIVGDADLDADSLPTRIKGIEITGDGITVWDFNTHATQHICRDDLALLVIGTLRSSRTDSLEKKRRRGKEAKVLDETTADSDQAVLDIYSRSEARGWRIHLAGFDFTCLGQDKSLLAGENLRRLVTALSEYAPNAKVVTDYARIRNSLDAIWPVESRKDPQGLQRAGFGKVEFGSVASTNNVIQFTKYSRLQWHLL
ncbi:MAG: hypothetical protein IPM59_06785 [Chloracidobacterium sp.]|nr:hypothetical protein [Chloracidobacterium sp.]